TWDDELAEIAQRWAIQCKFGHDKCRNVDSRWSWIGQNGAKAYGKITYPMDDLVQMWYDEVKDFDRNKVEKYEFDYNIGHYSQVVWAKTTKVGCGLIKYKESNDWISIWLVCNYGPSGNYRDEKVYEIKK
ncbi:PREDICTED: venom allergen 3-like, partial [Wasmannia auropunctata]|uniref:venom allergen 3-like n=1 Tax=Wasmannia auropunctata TaxID=64793 RepID=UPI0005F02F69